MMKNSFLIVLLAAALGACNQSATKQDTADSTKTIDTMAPDKVVTDSASAKIITKDTSSAAAVTADKLITPGKGIGHILLNEDVALVTKELGRADSSDAAMGSSLMVWFANHDVKGYRTSVFAGHNMGSKDENVAHVKKILITSPWFKTAENIGVGSEKNDIAKSYTIKPTSTYKSNGHNVQVYTDLKKGISFEIDNISNKCVGVVVHKPNDTATAYLNMH